MKTFRFLDFPVYKESKLFFFSCINYTKSFSRPYWELANQLQRASLSVTLNIAEGSAKTSDKDFNRFIEISLGSINESFACLDIAKDHALINQNDFNKLQTEAESITKQLGGLSKKLRSTIS